MASAHTRHSATIASTATAVPPNILTLEDVKFYMRKVFDVGERRLDAMMTVIDHAQVRKRHSVFPVEYFVTPRSLEQISLEYEEHAVRLGRQAADRCLQSAAMTPADIDLIITVSCTGFMIPSLDAHLINLMGFRSNVRRLPMTELGCVAGAMALARAREFLQAYPGKNVLIVAVELATLTFQRGDSSQANLVSCALFGDGAAAAVVTGRPVAGPQILDADTYTFPQSLDAMGFDLRDSGLHIVLSKDVPQMIRDKVRALADNFLRRSDLTLGSIGAFLLHPGGQKLLSYVEEQLGLSRGDTQLSWDVLSEYGNLSSATILFILHECLTRNGVRSGEYGLAAAFGPGFSAEMLLLQWS
ncbi:MAG TPA: type III polyketide synthase [Vicinamibacterales bacterium]|jgi:alkylresorcinol/alkylpyrone synthase|nr:type III polyketide synthase [Vicinamibacterales bacterium]